MQSDFVPDILDAASKVQSASRSIIVPVQVKRKDKSQAFNGFKQPSDK